MQQGNQPLKAIVVRAGRSAQKVYLPLLRHRQDVELAGIYSRTLKAAASVGAAPNGLAAGCRIWSREASRASSISCGPASVLEDAARTQELVEGFVRGMNPAK